MRFNTDGQIITSPLDTDLYKFTMQQCVLHRFPNAIVEYEFKCRTEGIDFKPYVREIEGQIELLCQLTFKDDELEFLKRLRFMKEDYIEHLRLFRFNSKFVEVSLKGKDLVIKVKGPWYHTILFEVPILAIVNEVYFRNNGFYKADTYIEGEKRLVEKMNEIKAFLNVFKFADFGTRRRFSRVWQEYVLETLSNDSIIRTKNLTGTSNVYFAKKFNLTPIGTMAHEFLQAAQALGPRLIDSQKFALENWVQEYRGDLGIALSDVLGMDAFLKDFDLYFAKLFDGARHDSGDPYEWCKKLIAHYKNFKIDPRTKIAVFSDGLNVPLALNLARTFNDQINTSFGIGTNLTNDLGPKALQIVMKMVRCNGQPVAKVSDSSGKQMCQDDTYLTYLCQVFGIKLK